jgi:hypothetical protein
LGPAGESGGGRRREAAEVGGHGLASRFAAELAACGAALPSCGSRVASCVRSKKIRKGSGCVKEMWPDLFLAQSKRPTSFRPLRNGLYGAVDWSCRWFIYFNIFNLIF